MNRLTIALTALLLCGTAFAVDVVLGPASGLTWTGSGTTRVATWAAGGDPGTPASGLSLEIGTNGWDAYLTIPNMMTNGAYTFGFDPTNRALTNAMMTLTVTSQGYDDTGEATTIQRTLYATTTIRKPYPNQAQRDEVIADTTNTKVRLALSDYVYGSDTVTAVAVSGLYKTGTTNSPSGTIAVSCLSTQASPLAIANWSMPGFNLITGSTFEVRAVAFHCSAQDGRPIRTMRFRAADTSGHTNTIYVTNATVSRLSYDTNAICEYIGNIPSTGLVQGQTVTVHFAAYPWVGSSGSVLDTATSTNVMPTMYYAPQYWVCDTGNVYGATIAVVDSTSGNDTTGVPVKLANFDTNSPPAAFATIVAAASKIAESNNVWYSRNDVGGGIVYLNAGGHIWGAGAGSVGNVPGTWLTVDAFPGVDPAAVSLTNQGGNAHLIKKVKCRRLVFSSGSLITFDSFPYLWLDEMRYQPAGDAAIYRQCQVYMTGCSIGSAKQGLKSYANESARFVLLRSCKFDDFTQGASPFVAIGNWRTNKTVTTSLYWATTDSDLRGCHKGGIWAFNTLYNTDASSFSLINIGGPSASRPQANGWALVQNIFEDSGVTGTQGLLGLSNDGNTNRTENFIVWHNTVVGQRMNSFYNDSGTDAVLKHHCSVVGNLMEDANIKTDVFATSSNNVGNWACLYGVGDAGNFLGNIAGVGDSTFTRDWPGIASIESASGTSFATNYVAFVRRAAASSVAGAGNGDYRLAAGSVLDPVQTRNVLPYDIEGNSRAVTNRPGAYR